jgi:hypothetical protein
MAAYAQFKLLERELSVDLLAKDLEQRGLEISGHQNPESAYEDEVLDLSCKWLQEDSIRVVISRRWAPDGILMDDSGVHFVHNDHVLLSLNLSDLLRSKLEKPLRTIVRESLLEAASTTTGVRPK